MFFVRKFWHTAYVQFNQYLCFNGISLHGELELLVRAGFSPSAALAAATSLPASVFHLNDRGRIAPGLRADLVLVRGNPTQDITATRSIVAVWKLGIQDGRVIASSGHLQAEAEGKDARK